MRSQPPPPPSSGVVGGRRSVIRSCVTIRNVISGLHNMQIHDSRKWKSTQCHCRGRLQCGFLRLAADILLLERRWLGVQDFEGA